MVSLRPGESTVYNTQKCEVRPEAPPAGLLSGARIGVTTFEDFGRKLDQEIERLREVATKKITPAARLKTAKSLRKMSDKLAEMAADLESKVEPKPDSR